MKLKFIFSIAWLLHIFVLFESQLFLPLKLLSYLRFRSILELIYLMKLNVFFFKPSFMPFNIRIPSSFDIRMMMPWKQYS